MLGFFVQKHSPSLGLYSVINSSSRTTQLHTNIMKGVGCWVNEDGGVFSDG